jgi:integrase
MRRQDGREAIDDSEQRRRNISFHSLRHTFVSLLRLAGVEDFQVQALAGHKSAAMMEKYSHRREVMRELNLSDCGKVIEGFFMTA